jgi:hypothetical protein
MNEELRTILELSDQIRDRIIEECQITRATFYNWKNEKTPIPFWAKEKINEITKETLDKEVFINEPDKN